MGSMDLDRRCIEGFGVMSTGIMDQCLSEHEVFM